MASTVVPADMGQAAATPAGGVAAGVGVVSVWPLELQAARTARAVREEMRTIAP